MRTIKEDILDTESLKIEVIKKSFVVLKRQKHILSRQNRHGKENNHISERIFHI